MLVVGARGFANEILEVLHQMNQTDGLVFYDDINMISSGKIHDKFPVLNSFEEASAHFLREDKRFILGLGNPKLRKQMYDAFTALGGVVTSTVSTNTSIGHYGIAIGEGSNIFDRAVLSSHVSLGICTIVYYGVILTHDTQIGNFVDISPGAILLGRSSVGDYTQIGSHATILPDISIGKNVVVAAGAVVTKNVPDNCMVAGVPAEIKKTLKPLPF
ncbi:sugar O-acyltransferase, sialic acid O-acetyltransferase NeuD family [Formosa sp. Hel1_31_208]|uniref:NeuD/PglB/VioB family sugar acetyltransferase n=1 Tax=Formosa sp. Hel1_31_208 TaxID=1798225 RepID=UPI00087C1A4C|nr:NeuD/PglB/VioB family sugar acetyltransferase [Formosa sp. Hel1_31_208]SDS69205.1 sugar O-acyltransferase, sialic acid O-acetyltransferase NeuD family [Formosa sp. Hel1_31_208]